MLIKFPVYSSLLKENPYVIKLNKSILLHLKQALISFGFTFCNFPWRNIKHLIPVGACSGITNPCVLFTILPCLAQIPFFKGFLTRQELCVPTFSHYIWLIESLSHWKLKNLFCKPHHFCWSRQCSLKKSNLISWQTTISHTATAIRTMQCSLLKYQRYEQ